MIPCLKKKQTIIHLRDMKYGRYVLNTLKTSVRFTREMKYPLSKTVTIRVLRETNCSASNFHEIFKTEFIAVFKGIIIYFYWPQKRRPQVYDFVTRRVIAGGRSRDKIERVTNSDIVPIGNTNFLIRKLGKHELHWYEPSHVYFVSTVAVCFALF
jgi:hypothetical protein